VLQISLKIPEGNQNTPKERQCNGQNKTSKRTNNDLQTLHGKPKIGKNEPTKDTGCINVLKINLKIPEVNQKNSKNRQCNGQNKTDKRTNNDLHRTPKIGKNDCF
jgi:hypothetical protein